MLQAAGAVQLGCAFAPFDHADYPPDFPFSGNWTPLPGSSPPTPGIYALSIPGVLPSTCTTQLQAGQACALAGKRLVTGAEWQLAAAGTPDPGALDDDATTCVTSGSGPATTGSRSACVSSWGARDMVGNVWEWVADAADRNGSSCTNFSALLGDDLSCFGGDGVDLLDRMPAGVIRGGYWGSTSGAGVFAVSSSFVSWDAGLVSGGFRCAR